MSKLTKEDFEREMSELNVLILFYVFLALKLAGHIDWSWWWVTAPLWLLICVHGKDRL